MLALSDFIGNALIGIIAALGAAVVLAIVRAGVQTTRKRQTASRDDASLREYFFDTPENPRTGVPRKKGWTTKVDETLGNLTAGLNRIERAVHDIRSEVKEDGNGGHNLRGDVQRAARAAHSEATAQAVERDRVQRNEGTVP